MIRGNLKFDSPEAVKPGQKITVTLQDTSRVGSGAIDLAQITATVPPEFDAASDVVPFEFQQDGLKGTIKAHLSQHSGPDIQIGDLITMTTIHATDGDTVTVPLHRVE